MKTYQHLILVYYETNHVQANEKKHSYLWPLCALIQAANEEEVLFDLGATFQILSVEKDSLFDELRVKMKVTDEGAALAQENIKYNNNGSKIFYT